MQLGGGGAVPAPVVGEPGVPPCHQHLHARFPPKPGLTRPTADHQQQRTIGRALAPAGDPIQQRLAAEDFRTARRRPFGSGEAASSPEPASTSAVVRGVPRDFGGNTAGEVVRQASDDDRDGGNVLGRRATHGQHGVVLAAPGRWVRSGSLRAELLCPLKASHGPGPSHPDPGRPQ